MSDLLTLMLSVGRWRSVNVCVTHGESEKLPVEKDYKYTAMLLLKCLCWSVQPDLVPQLPKPVHSPDMYYKGGDHYTDRKPATVRNQTHETAKYNSYQ